MVYVIESGERMNSEQLINEAKRAREHAYSPHSNFAVGAALLGEDGVIYRGCNIENVSFGLTNCAERTAFFNAISAGMRKFEALAIVGDTENPIPPCGACRQVMVEFCDKDMPVFCTNLKGDVFETTVEKLLPGAFSKEDLAHARK